MADARPRANSKSAIRNQRLPGGGTGARDLV